MVVEYRLDDCGLIHHDMQTCSQASVASCPIQSVEKLRAQTS